MILFRYLNWLHQNVASLTGLLNVYYIVPFFCICFAFLSLVICFNFLAFLDSQSKAKEMVLLAEKMRQKLLSGSNSQSNSTNEDEMGSKEEIQDWLLSVGIISPVTKESAGAMYHQQLSRQVRNSPICVFCFPFCQFLIVIICGT